MALWVLLLLFAVGFMVSGFVTGDWRVTLAAYIVARYVWKVAVAWAENRELL